MPPSSGRYEPVVSISRSQGAQTLLACFILATQELHPLLVRELSPVRFSDHACRLIDGHPSFDTLLALPSHEILRRIFDAETIEKPVIAVPSAFREGPAALPTV